MNPRELIILILGLAIVAVVLRGLYVALKARRGQIKLSIDKNIPQDIDFEALELAELPGGGARVVERPPEQVKVQNSKLEEAQERAIAINLGDSGSAEANIPVLMDAVELSGATTIPEQEPENLLSEVVAEPEIDDEDIENIAPVYDDQEWPHNSKPLTPTEPERSIGNIEDETGPSSNEYLSIPDEDEDEGEGEGDQGFADEQRLEEDARREFDDVLLDYDQNDTYQRGNSHYGNRHDQNHSSPISEADALASIAPDYPKTDQAIESPAGRVKENWESEGSAKDEGFHLPAFEQSDEAEVDYSPRGDSPIGDRSDQDEEDSPDEGDESSLAEDSGNPNSQSFDQQLDDFSMTAGERIGYDNNIIKSATAAKQNPAPQTPESEQRLSGQSNLFDDTKASAEDIEPSVEKKIKKPWFFSVFKRKPKEVIEQPAPILMEETELLPIETMHGDDASLGDEVAKTATEPLKKSNYVAASDTQPTEVLVINVMARDGYSFDGDHLLQVLITAGLRFGGMNIFHHHLDSNTKGPVLYSVANVLNPGTFDLNNMSDFSTLGVSFFLALPTSINNLDAFGTMLSVAKKVKDGLDGELRDDQMNLMTPQTIEHYRQRVRDFELSQLKAGIRG
jgi:cell division protein ZipA